MPTPAGQTIALCMIVRNEEAVIERCLRSVHDLVDTWVICDTGSTDRTRDLVQTALGDLPGRLHETSWIDFGHNRSELMELAAGSADYLLLIDADMEVVLRAPLPPLTADAYLLRETGPLDFAVVRLVRGDRKWWYEGATHEHIATDGDFRQQQLDELVIDHHADGSSHREKLFRDVALLKHDLERKPNDPRTIFYLAQTFRDLRVVDVAIDYYRQRVELGGWDEEVFYANLQEGILRSWLDLDTAVPVLLEAWERRPTRAEPLYELARAYRQRGDFALAYLFADRGLQIPHPDDVLFVHRWVYEWGLRLERGLAAKGLMRVDEAHEDLLTLLREAVLSRETERHIAQELAEMLSVRFPDADAGAGARPGGPPRLSALAPSARIGEIELDVSPRWPSFNPSIAPNGEGFRMIVRTANYEIQRGVLHSDGILLNVNYLLELDPDLKVTSVEPIVDHSTGPIRYPGPVQGYEDCRLFQVGDRWYATATSCELNPIMQRDQALLTLDGAEIAKVHRLVSPYPGRHEKNWMPVVLGDQLHFLYRCGPMTTLLHCDPESGALQVVSEHAAPKVAVEFRGGSQGLQLDDGSHLFVVHEVDRTERTAQYLHRFVLADERFRLTGMSPAFTFAAEYVEFCAGIARRNGDLVLSFGVSDAAAGLALVSVDEALGLVEPFTS